MSKTVCVDFDGVLHSYTSPWTGPSDIFDNPVPGAQAFCQTLLDVGYSIVITSTRASFKSGLQAMEQWLHQHNFPKEIQIATGEKPPAVIYIDDRGYRFYGDFDNCLQFIQMDVQPWNKISKNTVVLSDKPQLIVCVGYPKAGKSTWARRQLHPIVNPDSIRLALHGQRYVAIAEPHVWAIAKTMVRSLFIAGHRVVILDATNTSKKRRDEWQSKEWDTRFKVFNISKEECIRRAGDDREIIPVIERMAAAFEPLQADELQFIS